MLNFPLTFIMKVIMQAETAPGGNRALIEAVLSDTAVACDAWKEKASGAGRFVSYSVSLTVQDRTQFVRIHERVAGIPGVRFVL